MSTIKANLKLGNDRTMSLAAELVPVSAIWQASNDYYVH
jgi:hypothetical protein